MECEYEETCRKTKCMACGLSKKYKAECDLYKKALFTELSNSIACHLVENVIEIPCRELSCGSDECIELHLQAAGEEEKSG
jgi:hypothetical protein